MSRTMTHSITVWNLAPSPNYNTNIDLEYPYSEVPYIGQYKLLKIPKSLNELIEHVDYWGEGRITTAAGASGFTNTYNVNHHYQLVSNGTDRDKKIPNRIPVVSYTNCDTSSYVKDNSVKVVTLMGAPINTSCARDIARMINPDVGKVVVYGFSETTADIRNLNNELAKKGILPCKGYNLPDQLQGLTLFDSHRTYLNLNDLKDVLYKKVSDADYDNAIDISKTFDDNSDGDVIGEVVRRLIDNGINNVVAYAFQLWHCGKSGENIVENHFPLSFKMIVSGNPVKIINKKYMLALKLDANVDYYGDRLAWGDGSDQSSKRVEWQMVSNWNKDNNNLTFYIKNIEHGMCLKMDVNANYKGNRKIWGANLTSEERFLWTLEPIKLVDDILFLVVDKRYGSGMRLDSEVDSYNDRILMSGDSIHNDPYEFGWYITAWN